MLNNVITFLYCLITFACSNDTIFWLGIASTLLKYRFWLLAESFRNNLFLISYAVPQAFQKWKKNFLWCRGCFHSLCLEPFLNLKKKSQSPKRKIAHTSPSWNRLLFLVLTYSLFYMLFLAPGNSMTYMCSIIVRWPGGSWPVA